MVPKDSWKISAENTALVTIDLQNTFIAPGAPVECAEARTFIPKVNELASVCRRLRMPVIHIYVAVRPDQSDAGLRQEFRPPSGSELDTVDGSKGVELYKDLDVKESDYLVKKVRYSALIPGSSSLEPLLRGLGRTSIIICGVATDVCVGTTTYDAMMLGFRVFFASDLTATLSLERQKVALEVIDRNFAKVMTSDEIVNQLRLLERSPQYKS
jgi:ureidoacrylate peracid hydrolase